MLFFLKDTATPEIYTLSLHDALPIGVRGQGDARAGRGPDAVRPGGGQHERTRVARALAGSRGPAPTADRSPDGRGVGRRSEEHTSELQSRQYLVCRLLLEKKKKNSTD